MSRIVQHWVIFFKNFLFNADVAKKTNSNVTDGCVKEAIGDILKHVPKKLRKVQKQKEEEERNKIVSSETDSDPDES